MSAKTLSLPRVILGTMTFGGQTSEENAAIWVHDFMGNPTWADAVGDVPMVDTAIMYQGGKTQEILGRILQPYPGCSVATKANPFTKDKDLSPSGIRNQLEDSLKALQRDSVDIFYLHAPDARHPIEPTLEEVQNMYTENKFSRFALSNFSAWETVYIHSYMTQRNYVVPSIYQGMYNAITRQVETELFPALRKLSISFYAYNPLAGGMLSGKYKLVPEGDEATAAAAVAGEKSRFAGNSFWAKRYRERFQQKHQFEALEIVREALEKEGGNVNMADASLRWMRHHSTLSENDGIIVGASKTEHFQANMDSLSSGPLSENVVQAFDKASKLCLEVCPSYARGYSGSLYS